MNHTKGKLANAVTHYKYSKEAIAQYNLNTLHVPAKDPKPFDTSLIAIPNNNRKNLVLLGDSHAGMFARTINEMCEELNLNFIQITADATYPKKDAPGQYEGPKKYFNYIFESYIPLNQKDISLIIINANYMGYEAKSAISYVLETEKYFDSLKIPILFIGPNEMYNIDYPTFSYISYNYGSSFVENSFKDRVESTNNLLKQHLGTKYIDILKSAADGDELPNDIHIYLYDTHHMTYAGTQQHKNKIKSKITQLIKP